MDRFDLHIDTGKDGFGLFNTLSGIADILRRVGEDWAQMFRDKAGQHLDQKRLRRDRFSINDERRQTVFDIGRPVGHGGGKQHLFAPDHPGSL